MEERGLTQIYCGPGKGKTSVAIGQAVRAVGHGKRAIVIQFLKGKATTQLDYLSVLEPDIRLFRFEKKDKYYEDLTEAVPAFICIAFTIFANNIANGICAAIPAYFIMKIAAGKVKELSPVMYIMVAVCLLYFYTLI